MMFNDGFVRGPDTGGGGGGTVDAEQSRVDNLAKEYLKRTGRPFKDYVLERIEGKIPTTGEQKERRRADDEFSSSISPEQRDVVERVVAEEKAALRGEKAIEGRSPIVTQDDWEKYTRPDKTSGKGGSGVIVAVQTAAEATPEQRETEFDRRVAEEVQREEDEAKREARDVDLAKVAKNLAQAAKIFGLAWGVGEAFEEATEFLREKRKNGERVSIRQFEKWKKERVQQTNIPNAVISPPPEQSVLEEKLGENEEWNRDMQKLAELCRQEERGAQLPSEEKEKKVLRDRINEMWDKFKGPDTEIQRHDTWKDAVAGVIDDIIKRDADVKKEREKALVPQGAPDRYNPLSLAEEYLDRTINEIVRKGEDGNPPPDEEDSIKLDWYRGVKRNVQEAALKAELALYSDLGLENRPGWDIIVGETKKSLAKLKLEIDYLNFGDGIRDNTKRRLAGLATRYVDYIQTEGDQAEALKKVNEDKQKAAERAEREKSKPVDKGAESITNPEYLKKEALRVLALVMIRGYADPTDMTVIRAGLKHMDARTEKLATTDLQILEDLDGINPLDSKTYISMNWDRENLMMCLEGETRRVTQRRIIQLMGLDMAYSGVEVGKDWANKVNRHKKLGDFLDQSVFRNYINELGQEVRVDKDMKNLEFWELSPGQSETFKFLLRRQAAIDSGASNVDEAAKGDDIKREVGAAIQILRNMHIGDKLSFNQDHLMATPAYWYFHMYGAALDRIAKVPMHSRWRPYMKFHKDQFPEYPEQKNDEGESLGLPKKEVAPMVHRLFPEDWFNPIAVESSLFDEKGARQMTYIDFLREGDKGRVPQPGEFTTTKQKLTKQYGFANAGQRRVWDVLFGGSDYIDLKVGAGESNKWKVEVDLTFDPNKAWMDGLGTAINVTAGDMGLTKRFVDADPSTEAGRQERETVEKQIQQIGGVLAMAAVGLGLERDTLSIKDLSAWAVGVSLEGLTWTLAPDVKARLISEETAKWIKWHGKPTIKEAEMVVRGWFSQVRLQRGENWQDYYERDLRGDLPPQDEDLIARLRFRASGLVGLQEAMEVKKRLDYRRRDGWTNTWFGGAGTFSERDWREQRSNNKFMINAFKLMDNGHLLNIATTLNLNIYEAGKTK